MSRPSFGIVLKTDPLLEEYLPATFIGRQEQVACLTDALRLAQHGRGLVVWLHGPPGGGKSSIARKVLSQLEEHHVRTALVNCFSEQTLFAVLERVLRELQTIAPVMRDVSFKLERLYFQAKKGPLVIVLDELDQMLPRDRNAALYNFSRLPNAALVCLTTSRSSYLDLDPRVQSRLRPLFFEFLAYQPQELVQILKERAESSLVPDSWCLSDLDRIAVASRGDARVAIQSLRIAAYLAEKDRSPQLRMTDIDAGIQKGMELHQRYILGGLTEHHRLLHKIVADAGEITTANAWIGYQRLAKEQSIESVARRTFDKYKHFLIVNRLIEERQQRGGRNQRVLRVLK